MRRYINVSPPAQPEVAFHFLYSCVGMRRAQFIDLDMLDSPASSVNSVPWASSSAPGSSAAEKIFNDPHSWHNASDTPIGESEAIIWLAEELEKYGDHLTDDTELSLSPIEQFVKRKHLSGRYATISLPIVSGFQTQPEEIGKDETRPFLPPPNFDRSGLDLGIDLNIRLSTEIWDGSTQSRPSPIIFSPPSSSSTGQSVKSSILPLDLAGQSEGSSTTPPSSPVAPVSASTTWSILELYGVHPDTPDSGRPLIEPNPVLPAARPTPNPSLTTPRQAALIRPLPVIPDSLRDSPIPPLSKSTVPPRKPSGPSTPSPSPPTMKISSRTVPKAPHSKPSDLKPSKYPGISRKLSGLVGPQLPDNSHSPSTTRMKTSELSRFISLPLPSSWLSSPQHFSPSVPPSPPPGRPGSATRSPPPLGPRPRAFTVLSQSQ